MTEAIAIALIAGIVSVIASVMASAIQYRKWSGGEQAAVGADAAGEITVASIALVNSMRSEIAVIRSELEALRDDNKRMRVMLVELEDVQDWAERLVYQVRSLGAEPVKMRVTEMKP